MTKGNYLYNTNYRAITSQAQTQMQQLLSITQSGNWEQILAILQNQITAQGVGKSSVTGSIFNATASVEQAVSGNDEQKAVAFQNILNALNDLLGSLGTGE